MSLKRKKSPPSHDSAEPGSPKVMIRTNGQVSNGAANGHAASNGHPNSYPASNGHASNGHSESNGHCSNGHAEGAVNAKYLARIEEPYLYQTKSPGKGVRDKCIDAMNQWLNVDQAILSKIKELIKILHESSLLIDDIQDNSKMRRGRPTAHIIFGIPEVINIANLKYFEAGRLVLQLDDTNSSKGRQAHMIFNEWMIQLHQGQGLDIYWRDHFICPTEEEYIDMVLKKTGGLMMLAFDLMDLFRTTGSESSGFSTVAGHRLLSTFSTYFQIRDDYCNLWDTKYKENKSYCEDLTEGKFSWVIIQGILKERSRGETKVESLLKQHTECDSVKKYCCDLLEEFGVKRETEEKLQEMDLDLRQQIKSLGGNKIFSKIFELLSLDQINR